MEANKKCPTCGKFWRIAPGRVTAISPELCSTCKAEAVRVVGRVCWSCKHFVFDSGMPGYSDATPGCIGSMECGKNVFKAALDELTEVGLRESLMQAETCPLFEPRQVTT